MLERSAGGAGEAVETQGRSARASGRSAATIGAYGELALAQVDALAAEHAHAVLAGGALELAEQPRLADPGLTGHEGQGGPAGCGRHEGGTQLGQLRSAAYEPSARDPCRHMPMIAHGRVAPATDAG